jgi:predicted RNA-binding protein with PUA-like domain
MNYWLMKSEPSVFSIEDLEQAPGGTTRWDGVRNYQVRNMMRDEMQVGDLAFFYHSSCPEPGIAGLVELRSRGFPDPSAWDRGSEYFDAKSTEKKPLWYTVDVRLKRRFDHVIGLAQLRGHEADALAGLALLRKGNRLSITKVDPAHWRFILSLA